MTETFKSCGHPRTPDNLRQRGEQYICRTCDNAYHRAYVARRTAERTPQERYDDSRRRYLPKQIAGLRRKRAALEAEALRRGFPELVENKNG